MTNKNETVVKTNEVVDNITNNQEEIKMETKSKAQLAQQIFAEVNGVRADFMKRVMEELGMSKAGGSTYFQNCKTRANGQKVKHYYKPKSKVNEQQVDEKVNDEMVDAEVFEVELVDGTIKCFMSQQAVDEFKEANPTLIKQ